MNIMKLLTVREFYIHLIIVFLNKPLPLLAFHYGTDFPKILGYLHCFLSLPGDFKNICLAVHIFQCVVPS